MEATFVYHLIKEGQSFQSATCTSQLIREVFGKNPDFRCAETKAEAIASGTFYFQFIYFQLLNRMKFYFRCSGTNGNGYVVGRNS